MTATAPRRAALYARISRDRVGAGLGVERQEADCRDLAARLGWTVAEVFADNDLSAYSGKPRPRYRAMLDGLRTGRVNAVLAWHTDRLHRSPVELEDYITASEAADAPTHTVRAGPLDLATPSGRMIARQLGAVARYEVEHMIERQQAAKAQAAAAGLYRGGRRPYGYARDGVTVEPAEAAVIADATARVLAGESLHAVTRDLNARGIRTSTGATWKAPALRDVLLRARNAGLIERNGEVLGDAQWPAIVDRDTWHAVRALLTAPGRRPESRSEWLGSGLYRCGLCDGPMRISGYHRVPVYRCTPGSDGSVPAGERGRHVTRVAAPVDELVTALVLGRLSQPDARLLLRADAPAADLAALHARADGLRARLDELAGLFAAGTVDARQLATGTASLRERLAEVEGELAEAVAGSPLAGFADAEVVVDAWAAAPVPRRRGVVDALMTVSLRPAPRGRRPGGGYFDPTSVEITWRGSN